VFERGTSLKQMHDHWDAAHCRNHAGILRTLADEIEHDDHQRKLLHQIAENFESMASAFELSAKVENLS